MNQKLRDLRGTRLGKGNGELRGDVGWGDGRSE
jgi:hypothetical protein